MTYVKFQCLSCRWEGERYRNVKKCPKCGAKALSKLIYRRRGKVPKNFSCPRCGWPCPVVSADEREAAPDA